jgi:D-alanyl-D-alanine carboxypeptidase
MTWRKKILISALVLTSLSLWAVKAFSQNVNDFLFWHEMSHQRERLLTELNLEEQLKNLRPSRNQSVADLATDAQAAISILIKEDGQERILFENNSQQILPIASLTKLMTAWVVLQHYDLTEEITLSIPSANQYGELGKLQAGDSFSTEYLLYPLLMESSNGAAMALAQDYPGITLKDFVGLMNLEAEKMGLTNTFFDNPSGLDPEESQTKINYSSATDLAVFTQKLLSEPLIWEILSLPKYSLYGPELINTNKFLLDETAYWQNRIIGGKTGYTEKAGGCFLLTVEAPKGQGTLINIILGANGRENRFDEMKKLVDWLKVAYKW